jgi:hypothetical protein
MGVHGYTLSFVKYLTNQLRHSNQLHVPFKPQKFCIAHIWEGHIRPVESAGFGQFVIQRQKALELDGANQGQVS